MKKRVPVVFTFIVLLGVATPALAFRPLPLSAQEQKLLRDNFALCNSKLKGPYTENSCICPGGAKLPVMGPGGQIRNPCRDPLFCAAFRAPWAEALGKQRMYIANLFSRDLYLWDSFPDHNDLVRGYILEKYFIETNPNSKLSELKAYGGLSGAEYETPASARFFERYLSAPEFNDNRDFLLAYELQKRYFVHGDLGQIEKVRALAVRIQTVDPKFKPLRDAIHNQLSPGLVPQLVAFRDTLPPGSTRSQVDELTTEIKKLTSLDETALQTQVAAVEDEGLRSRLSALLPAANADPVDAISSLARLTVLVRQTVAARTASPPDARRLIDLDITVAGVIQQRGNILLQSGTALSTTQYLQLLSALTDATYGVGLLGEREHEAATSAVHDLLSAPQQSRQDFTAKLKDAERVVEWAQSNAVLAFAEVWAAWTFVLPQTASIRDDILRSSPLLLYAQAARHLDDYAAGPQRTHHDFFGTAVDTDVRALNPGLALGRLRVAPTDGAYTRDEIVALPDTPADLDPAAGILTQGEGNVLSHVQLLARALGIPNVVLGPSAYQRIVPHNGQQVFFIVTPGDRVIIKEASAMTPQDKAVYEEYTRNQTRTADGSLGNQGPRLHIDRTKIDLSKNMPIDLNDVRRKDSGHFCGPKAAYLGELKHLFPDHVATAGRAEADHRRGPEDLGHLRAHPRPGGKATAMGYRVRVQRRQAVAVPMPAVFGQRCAQEHPGAGLARESERGQVRQRYAVLRRDPAMSVGRAIVMDERDGKKPYQNLWIASRGPASHGCTRLGSGHVSELRQIVPSESNVLERVATFRSLPQCYDVFDIDGNGVSQVMGVQYYLVGAGHTLDRGKLLLK